MLEAGHVAEVEVAGEDPDHRQEGERDHRDEAEHRREAGSDPDPQIRRYEEEQDPHRRDREGPPGDEGVDRREPRSRVQVEAIADVERRQDHVQRRHREPAEPVRPGGDAVGMVGDRAGPFLPEGRIHIGRRTAGALGHHRRELGEEEAEDPTAERHEDDQRDGSGPQRGDHHGRDAGDEDRPGEAHYEGAPPIRLARQTTTLVRELILGASGSLRVRRSGRLVGHLSSLSRGLEYPIPTTPGGRRQALFEQIGSTGVIFRGHCGSWSSSTSPVSHRASSRRS